MRATAYGWLVIELALKLIARIIDKKIVFREYEDLN